MPYIIASREECEAHEAAYQAECERVFRENAIARFGRLSIAELDRSIAATKARAAEEWLYPIKDAWHRRMDGVRELEIAREHVECASKEAKPECAYCDRTDGLRLHHDGGGYIAPDYVCEDCFHGTDTGPGFDDLPLAQEGRAA